MYDGPAISKKEWRKEGEKIWMDQVDRRKIVFFLI